MILTVRDADDAVAQMASSVVYDLKLWNFASSWFRRAHFGAATLANWVFQSMAKTLHSYIPAIINNSFICTIFHRAIVPSGFWQGLRSCLSPSSTNDEFVLVFFLAMKRNTNHTNFPHEQSATDLVVWKPLQLSFGTNGCGMPNTQLNKWMFKFQLNTSWSVKSWLITKSREREKKVVRITMYTRTLSFQQQN